MGRKKGKRMLRRAISSVIALICVTALLAAQGNLSAFAKQSDGAVVSAAIGSTRLPSVSNAATISTQPKDVTAAVGATAKFSVAATGTGTLTYQWQLKGPSATAWKNSSSPNATKATFSLKVQAGHDGYQFRCVVKDGSGETTTSNAATLTVQSDEGPTITKQPADVTVEVGKAAKFTVAATGTGTLTYQWQTKSPTGTAWKNSTSANAKKATFSLTVSKSHNGYQFRCVITDGNGKTSTSNAATLTVPEEQPPQITTQPADVTVEVGKAAKFTVAATGTGTLTYQWQTKSPTGTAWKNSTSANAKKATFSLTVSKSHNGYQFRCVITDGNGKTSTSDAATLTVMEEQPPQITTQPKDISAPAGKSVKFTVAATGTGTLTYRWQTKSPSGTTWKNSTSASAKTASFSITVKEAHEGYQFRCVITDGNGLTATSNAATFTLGVMINSTYFKDAAFRTYLSDTYDKNGNGALSTAELNAVTSINVSGRSIKNLTGIGYFPYLKNLNCANNSLATLDLSGNANLQVVNCAGNSLTAIDLSANASLTRLNCSNNKLTELNLDSCTALATLNVKNNPLTTLDLTACTELTPDNVIVGSGVSVQYYETENTYEYVYYSLWSQDITSIVYAAVPGSEIVLSIQCNDDSYAQADWEVGGISVDGDFTPDEGLYMILPQDPTVNQEFEFRFSTDDIKREATSSIIYNAYNGFSVTQVKLVEPLGTNRTANDITTHGYVITDEIMNAREGSELVVAVSWYDDKNWPSYGEIAGGISVDGSWTPSSDFLFDASESIMMYRFSVDDIRSSATGEITIFLRDGMSLQTVLLIENMNGAKPEAFPASDPVVCTIDGDNFPNENFREYVRRRFDKNGDGSLSEREIARAYNIDVYEEGYIDTLEGIEWFSNLRGLNCYRCELTTLDISHNPALYDVNCSGNEQMTTLTIGNLEHLYSLNCCDDSLTSLDVSGCPELSMLYCADNQLEELDLSGNSLLKKLSCGGNLLTELDVSHNGELKNLECSGNAITALNVDDNPNLQYINCNDNQISELLVSNNMWLRELHCAGNQLTSLYAESKSMLEVIDCSNNSLTELYVSYDGSLFFLRCNGNYLTSIDLTGCYEIGTVNADEGVELCYGATNIEINEDNFPDPAFRAFLQEYDYSMPYGQLSENEIDNITELDLSDSDVEDLTGVGLLTGLLSLDCRGTNITAADLTECRKLSPQYVFFDEGVTVTYNPLLTEISAENFPDDNFRGYVENTLQEMEDGWLTPGEIEQITVIDVEGLYISDLTGIEYFPYLKELYCAHNKLTDLDLRNNTALVSVSCHDNDLYHLYLNGCTELQSLSCSQNQLSDLNLEDCTNLISLDCGLNDICWLENIDDCTSLENLICDYNNLDILDLSGLEELKKFSCIGCSGLTTVTFSDNYTLTEVNCNDCELETLDLSTSNSVYLKIIWCDNNNLTELVLPELNMLEELHCAGNKLTDRLFENHVSNIRVLDCSNNEIRNISIDGNNGYCALEELDCRGNGLESLEIRDCSKLKTLNCSNNSLQELDVSECPSLSVLYCDQNDLSELILSDCSALRKLNCSHNALTSLVVDDCIALTVLDCSENDLSELDLSMCTKLKKRKVTVDEDVDVAYSEGADDPDPYGDRDLEGKEIVIGDWWSNNWMFARDTEARQEYADFQDTMMEDHNYTLKRESVFDWGNMAEVGIMSIITNEPIADIFVLDYRFLGPFMQSEDALLVDLSTLEEFDFSDARWNRTALAAMTVGDSIYGTALASEAEARCGIYFNKDKIAEILGASYVDKPYDWQAQGQWNWAKFKEFASALTVDTDNDGKTDIYGFSGQQCEFFEMAVVSNGHEFVVRNSQGEFVSNVTSDDVISDCNWAYSFYTEGITRRQTTEEWNSGMWNYFTAMFERQQSVLYLGYDYDANTFNAVNDITGEPYCDFEFGFVCFPKGPDVDNYITLDRGPIYVIPNYGANQSKLHDIAYALNIYADTALLTEDPDYWRPSYEYYFGENADMLATIDLMLHDSASYMESSYLVPGLWDNNNGIIQAQLLYALDSAETTPAELLESVDTPLAEALSEFNAARIK